MVHYWALVLTFKQKNVSLYIELPLVIYNYKQEITSGHIDFDLKDVNAISDETKDLAMYKSMEAVEQNQNWISDLEGIFGKVKYELTQKNNIHRHPGGRNQSFSSTDLKTTIGDNIGIVYPIEGVNKDTPIFSSIMALQDHKCYLAHSEIRVISGSVDEGNLLYKKGNCFTIVKGKSNEDITEIERLLFGDKYGIEEPYIVNSGSCNDMQSEAHLIFKEIAEKKLILNPDFFISEENLKEKKYKYEKAIEFKTNRTLFGSGRYNGGYDDDEYELYEDYNYSYYEEKDKEKEEEKEKTIVAIPDVDEKEFLKDARNYKDYINALILHFGDEWTAAEYGLDKYSKMDFSSQKMTINTIMRLMRESKTKYNLNTYTDKEIVQDAILDELVDPVLLKPLERKAGNGNR